MAEPVDAVYFADCAARSFFDQVANKWSVMILTILIEKPTRFNEFIRRLEGVTHKALTQALRRLERNERKSRSCPSWKRRYSSVRSSARSVRSFGREGRPFRRSGYCSFIATIPGTLMVRTRTPSTSPWSSPKEPVGNTQSDHRPRGWYVPSAARWK